MGAQFIITYKVAARSYIIMPKMYVYQSVVVVVLLWVINYSGNFKWKIRASYARVCQYNCNKRRAAVWDFVKHSTAGFCAFRLVSIAHGLESINSAVRTVSYVGRDKVILNPKRQKICPVDWWTSASIDLNRDLEIKTRIETARSASDKMKTLLRDDAAYG